VLETVVQICGCQGHTQDSRRGQSYPLRIASWESITFDHGLSTQATLILFWNSATESLSKNSTSWNENCLY
jgi:hypothetical protein